MSELTYFFAYAIYFIMRQRKPRRRHKVGFSEGTAPYRADATPAGSTHQTVELGAGGRLVIPSPVRAALGMKVGDRLTVRLDGHELKLYTYKEGSHQAREVLEKYIPAGVDPVEDFLAYRRREAALEGARFDERKRDD